MDESVGELAAQRNEELTAVFLSLLGDGRLARDIISSAASSPCSRFWITPQNAMRYIKMRLDGSWGDKGNELPQQVLKIDAIIRLCDGNYSPAKVRDVVEGPAPSFFLSKSAARDIIYRTVRKRRKWKRKRE